MPIAVDMQEDGTAVEHTNPSPGTSLQVQAAEVDEVTPGLDLMITGQQGSMFILSTFASLLMSPA